MPRLWCLTRPGQGSKGKKGKIFEFRMEKQKSDSPRRLRAKYTHRTNLRFMLCVFRGCAGPEILIRKAWRPVPERIRAERKNKNAKAFIYPADKTP